MLPMMFLCACLMISYEFLRFAYVFLLIPKIAVWFPAIVLWCPMTVLWLSYDVPMIVLRLFLRCPVSLWCVLWFPKIVLWWFLWFPDGCPTVPLWVVMISCDVHLSSNDVLTIFNDFLWCSYDVRRTCLFVSMNSCDCLMIFIWLHMLPSVVIWLS